MKRDAQDLVSLLRSGDRAMIVRFDIGYKVECELTADHTKLKKAIGGIVANRDRIRIMSGVIHQVVFREFAGVEGRRAIILLADPDSNLPPFGRDRSLAEKEPVKSYYENLERSDVAVFPIFYQTATFPREYLGKTLNFNQLIKIPGLDYFNSFAVLTGGRLYASGASNFKSAFEQILEEIRSQYVLSFHIERVNQRNSVSLKTVSDQFTVRAKQKVETNSSEKIKSTVSKLWSLRKK